jgi:hypothetical protein
MSESGNMSESGFTRRHFLGAAAAGTVGTLAALSSNAEASQKKAQIAITFDLEMSRHYPKRGMLEWDYQKGNLDDATKAYSVEAANIAKEMGGKIHFFCVGRVLEHANVDWLKRIAADGHPIGNHTYDHVNVLAKKPEDVQFRFKRSPWLVKGRTAEQVIRDNIHVTSLAMKQRAGIEPNGFRTPGGFYNALNDREDIQKLLLEQGFKWASCKYPRHNPGKPKVAPTDDIFANIVKAQEDAQPFRYPSGLIEIPMCPISDVSAFRTLFWKREYFLKAIRLCVERAIKHRQVFDFLCHPSCMVVEDPQHETIKLICELVQNSKDKAEIVGLDAIAESVGE